MTIAPGLSLLVQGMLGVAPLMVELVRNRQGKASLLAPLSPRVDWQDWLQGVSSLAEQAQTESNFEAEKRQQQQQAAYRRETQFKLAAYQRETTLKLPETQKILDNWPLRLYPSQILASHPAQGPLPLRIFLAVRGDRPSPGSSPVSAPSLEMEARLAQGLRTFLSQHYPLQSPTRPTEFLAGAWENQRFHSEASIKALFGSLKSEPTLILESEFDGPTLTFRVAYWGPGQATYYYQTIAQWPYQALLNAAARRRALAWQEVRDRLLALGEEPAALAAMAGAAGANLALVEKAAAWQAQGVDTGSLRWPYQIDSETMDEVWQWLIRYHCLVAAWIADSYHLVYRDVPPLLPAVLPDLIAPAADASLGQAPDLAVILEPIVKGYQQIYQALEDERRYWVPELALQLGRSLSHLPDKSWAREQVDFSLAAWLALRPGGGGPHPDALAALETGARESDRPYLEALREGFAALEDAPSVARLDVLLASFPRERDALVKPGLSPALLQGIGHRVATLPGYSGKTASLAISPEGDTLISGSVEKTVQVWDLPTGAPRQTLKGHGNDVSSVALSPDGKFLASSSLHCPKSNVRVWDLQTGKPVHNRLGHKKSVRFVAIDGAGRILSGSGDKVKIWNIKTGERLVTLSHPCPVNTAVASPDGKVLATGDVKGKIRLWNPQTGKLLRSLKGHPEAINALEFTPDGEILISASTDHTLRIWHLPTGDLIYTLPAHQAAVNAIALQSDRNLLVSGSADRTLKFWRLDNWELLHTLEDRPAVIASLALSADGQFLAAGSTDQTVQLWRL